VPERLPNKNSSLDGHFGVQARASPSQRLRRIATTLRVLAMTRIRDFRAFSKIS
jgi:hypothetical protein